MNAPADPRIFSKAVLADSIARILPWQDQPFRCYGCDEFRATETAFCISCDEITASYVGADVADRAVRL